MLFSFALVMGLETPNVKTGYLFDPGSIMEPIIPPWSAKEMPVLKQPGNERISAEINDNIQLVKGTGRDQG
jgi:hypothetical protein